MKRKNKHGEIKNGRKEERVRQREIVKSYNKRKTIGQEKQDTKIEYRKMNHLVLHAKRDKQVTTYLKADEKHQK